ncbi:hypothetical protein V474_13655 [Novosphingobium barchaimii LL02]|uniref:Uncharacterized protein n=1 Tax=Novosphingobium barchaimii LL02 TaxID=1114963 RepID=A0A0J8AQB4_9SPHN|nr:hypothetical protein [Novosphingobium barchaimii]KMS56605.1 hypothetical protein V474_13655 [Novosphingobium barchaimii LL02]
MTANSAAFDPADQNRWIARGRRPEHAEVLALVWKDYPDLPFDAPLAERMALSPGRAKREQVSCKPAAFSARCPLMLVSVRARGVISGVD